MSTIRDEFEKWRSGEHDGLVKAFTAREMSAARAAFEFATERAAKQERDRADELLKALKDLSKMYTHAWDLVDGGLTMMGESVPLFESRHKAASKAIERYEAAAIRAKGGA